VAAGVAIATAFMFLLFKISSADFVQSIPGKDAFELEMILSSESQQTAKTPS